MAYDQQKIEELRHLISISGNCVNLGRSLLAQQPELHSYCMESTKFLDSYGNVKFNERLYCIVNGITTRPHNYTGKPSNFSNLFQGYIVVAVPKPKPPKPPTRQEKYKRELAGRTKVYLDLLGIDFDFKRAKRIDEHVRGWPNGHGKQFYNDNMVEGIDYFVCPITGLRKSEFRELYYTGILGLTREQFCEISGLTDLSTPGRKQQVSEGVNAIDPETGKRKCEIAQERARETLSAVDPVTGLTGYQKKGQKTRATHMANVDEYGRNGYARIAVKAIIKGIQTKRRRGILVAENKATVFGIFKTLVHRMSKRNRKHLDMSKRGKAGTPGATQVDHKISIQDGFKGGVSPILLSSKNNQEVLPWEKNRKKGTTCSVSHEELCMLEGYTIEQSKEEFASLIELIESEIALSNGVTVSTGYIETKYLDAKLQTKHQV